MPMPGPKWLALGLLLACSEPEPPDAAPEKVVRPTLDILPEGTVLTKRAQRIAELTAEELVKLDRRRSEGSSVLTETDLALLAEYDGVLESILRSDEATPTPDGTKPSIVTRDYELWILPGADRRRYTVKDRSGNVLAERVDEDHLRQDFSYLHNLLHPEYLQFYDVVGD